jgi:hypothetical protein
VIAHVAAAGEDRGRIILHLGHGKLNTPAVEAALRVAQAFQSSIECVFVEDQQLYDLAHLPFSREVSRDGAVVRPAAPDVLELDLRCDAIAAQRYVTRLAAAKGVPQSGRIMRDTPVDALTRACAEHGPWNVIAMITPITTGGDDDLLLTALTSIPGHTGVVCMGTKVQASHGNPRRVLALIERLDDLHVLLRTSERLAAPQTPGTLTADITLLVTGSNAEPQADIEPHVRLALASREHVAEDNWARVAVALADGAGRVLEYLQRLAPEFLVARFGGDYLPGAGDPSPIIASLPCPIFIVR